MSLMRPVFELREQMNRLFHEMEEFQLPISPEFREKLTQPWFPAADLCESDGSYELKLEVPGIKPEDLDIQVQEDAVVIKGQTKEEKEERKKDFYRQECHVGSIYRRIPLPGTVKAEGATAELEHGLLKLKLPKAEEKTSKQIPVQAK